MVKLDKITSNNFKGTHKGRLHVAITFRTEKNIAAKGKRKIGCTNINKGYIIDVVVTLTIILNNSFCEVSREFREATVTCQCPPPPLLISELLVFLFNEVSSVIMIKIDCRL